MSALYIGTELQTIKKHYIMAISKGCHRNTRKSKHQEVGRTEVNMGEDLDLRERKKSVRKKDAKPKCSPGIGHNLALH